MKKENQSLDKKYTMHEKEVFENRSHFNKTVNDNYCEACDERLIFGMRDNHHDFSLGLSTVLECLLIAEKQGHIPELPAEWRITILNEFPKLQRI